MMPGGPDASRAGGLGGPGGREASRGGVLGGPVVTVARTHMSGIADFLSRRKQFTNEYFACPGSRKTVLVSSHIEWTDLIAHALLKLGYNVLIAEPWSLLWLDDRRFANFDNLFNQWVKTLKKFNVQLV